MILFIYLISSKIYFKFDKRYNLLYILSTYFWWSVEEIMMRVGGFCPGRGRSSWSPALQPARSRTRKLSIWLISIPVCVARSKSKRSRGFSRKTSLIRRMSFKEFMGFTFLCIGSFLQLLFLKKTTQVLLVAILWEE